jgi:hypothetical protein
LEAVSV